MSKPLRSFVPRDLHHAAQQAYRHGRRVAWLRRMLPLILVVIVVGLLVIPFVKRLSAPETIASTVVAPNLVVDNLQLTGRDHKNNPWTLRAKGAVRVAAHDGLFDLDQPSGTIDLANGGVLTGTAQRGRLEEKTRRLWLGGGVYLEDSQGQTFTTPSAWLDSTTGIAWGDQPITAMLRSTAIQGQGFKVLDKGATLIVRGPASMRIATQPPASD